MEPRPLPPEFFQADADLVAARLIGATLVHDTPEGRLSGRVVEAEAYFGPAGANPHLAERTDLPPALKRDLLAHGDPASHAGRGPTPRSAIMWGDPGLAYVYLIYGMYECLNVVTGPPGEPQAVLIRALAPLEGVPLMRARRPKSPERDLLRGPGRLARAMGLTRELTGTPLTEPPVYFAEGTPPRRLAAGPRVNVVGAEAYPLRFVDPDSPHLSRGPPFRMRSR